MKTPNNLLKQGRILFLSNIKKSRDRQSKSLMWLFPGFKTPRLLFFSNTIQGCSSILLYIFIELLQYCLCFIFWCFWLERQMGSYLPSQRLNSHPLNWKAKSLNYWTSREVPLHSQSHFMAQDYVGLIHHIYIPGGSKRERRAKGCPAHLSQPLRSLQVAPMISSWCLFG